MNKEVLCTKCGQSFSARGIRLHEMHCNGQLTRYNVEQKAEQPTPEAVGTTEAHQEVHTEAHKEAKEPADVKEEGGQEVQPNVHEDDESSWGDKVLGVVFLGIALLVGMLYLAYKQFARKAEVNEPVNERETLSEWQARQNQRKDNLTAATRMLGQK